jgi:hypothetical protein
MFNYVNHGLAEMKPIVLQVVEVNRLSLERSASSFSPNRFDSL